jgi:hypothetical protein
MSQLVGSLTDNQVKQPAIEVHWQRNWSQFEEAGSNDAE